MKRAGPLWDRLFGTWRGNRALSSSVDGAVATPHQRVHVKLENARGVEAENLRALFVCEMSHLALDRFRRMRPHALVMRVVVGPHEIVDEVVLHREVEADTVLLKRGRTVAAEVLARQL